VPKPCPNRVQTVPIAEQTTLDPEELELAKHLGNGDSEGRKADLEIKIQKVNAKKRKVISDRICDPARWPCTALQPSLLVGSELYGA
jgi:hypothetical protein